MDRQTLEALAQALNRSLLLESLREHDAIKALVDILKKDVEAFDTQLLIKDSVQLPDRARDRLLDRKALYKQVLAYMDGDALEQVRKEIDSQYNYVKGIAKN